MSASFLASLTSPYALVFAGQGSAWRTELAGALKFPGSAQRLQAAWKGALALTEPVALELLTAVPEATHALTQMVEGGAAEFANERDAAVSVPGIVLTQLAALVDLESTSLDFLQHPPAALLGHSQGKLGAALARAFIAGDQAQVESLLALAILIGHAASVTTREGDLTAHGEATPMLSIRGVNVADIDAQPAVVNGPRAAVFSGAPTDLVELQKRVQAAADGFNQALEAREFGGTELDAKFDFLPIGAPFHSELLAPALEQTMQWVRTINAANPAIDEDAAYDLAKAILVDPDNWVDELSQARAGGVQWFLDLGPSAMVTRMSAPLLAGSGTAMVDASGVQARTDLDTPGFEVETPVSWEQFAPRLVRLPDGREVVETAFTKLTGRSPIMLPGMTPTTVWPEIVAAAANGGYWSELAGGGQYSEEVFTENREELERLLEPGRAAGFNAMFFDRFMWNLQFGVNKIVPKARVNGAPFDSVTIAAGIPELDEARDLIKELSGQGFTNICFKPGSVGQINQVLDIADDNADYQLIIQVEDGHAGGHHSWENLDDLLQATYARIRATKNVVLAVGGGIGTPQRATDYLTGRWSAPYGLPPMPVDAVMIGTASMAVKEARTSSKVKQLLKDTPGVQENGGWVGRSKSAGGMTSGLSHLDADMYEIDNSSAKASKLIHELGGDAAKIAARREELIEALGRTAKPYFGDVEDMTYAQWATRAVQLCSPSTDWTWDDRVWGLFQRIEARLHEADHGQIETLFPDREAVADMEAALAKLLETYPQAHTRPVTAADAKWWVQLCRKYHKPMPFVPALDADLARWWGTDTLWQSHDERFEADAVRVIPGPISVAGIDRVDEPIAQMFARFEAEVAGAIDTPARPIFARLRGCETAEDYLRAAPHMMWAGNLVDNPAHVMPTQTTIVDEDGAVTIRIDCDTAWDEIENPPYAVRRIDIPVLLPAGCSTGGYPVVDMARLSHTAYDLLAGAAGVSTTTVSGDHIAHMPAVDPSSQSEDRCAGFGVVRGEFTFGEKLGRAHGAVTGGALQTQLASIVPDALVGPSWPTIYAALGTAIYEDVPVIEGLVNAVHLDQTITLLGNYPAAGARVRTEGECVSLAESSAGRVVTVEVKLFDGERHFANLIERFAIRGRVTTTTPPAPAPAFAPVEVIDTARSVLRVARVRAPHDMTAFANVSGDYNPIHTSYAAARLSGLKAPLVHGMWLSAVAQHVISARHVDSVESPDLLGRVRGSADTPMRITAWSYQMYGMVDLEDEIEITVERVGRVAGGELVVEATCRVGGNVVSIGRALLAAPRTAYVYPGQGIQRARMGMENMTPTVRQIWQRADQHTREVLGFSIEAIVRDNPTQIQVGEETLRHPEGVLNLTQFTQVALATLAYAQTAQLKVDGLFVEGAFYAGHSLGEYNALAATADIFPLEQVLEIVYQRGSAMHHLVERDAQGRSNYQMGALRPSEFGVTDATVRQYVEQVAEQSGEFLEIVNYNLAGAQYAVAGTIAGLKALAADAAARAQAHGGKRPFMLIPGVDVPFHSSVLRSGVPAFREKLLELLPADLAWEKLVGRYLPNLVARPFELTLDFALSILDVVPSAAVGELASDWERAMEDPAATARTLLVELLAWQFASPVRWIETQELLFNADALAVDRVVEVGLASSPTLANLAARTLQLPHLAGRPVQVWNLERDAASVRCEDVATAPEFTGEPGAASGEGVGSGSESAGTGESATAGAAQTAPAASPATAETVEGSESAAPSSAPAPSSPSAAGAVRGADAPDVPVKASDAVRILLAYANKMNPVQVEDADTVETLTNGVSSKRNQLLMDMAAELGVSSIEGASEASVDKLLATVDKAAGNYQAFGPVLTAAIGSRERALLGSAGMKPADVDTRVQSTWGLGPGWVARVHAELLLGTREGESVRGGNLATLATSVSGKGEAEALIDAAVTSVGNQLGIPVTLASGGSGGGEMVDSAALSALREEILGADGIFATQARAVMARLGLEEVPVEGGEPDTELLAALDAELGIGWADSVRPAFAAGRAVLLDDRWALAREDLARAFAGEDLAAERLHGGGQSLADLARWYAQHSDDPARFGAYAEAALQDADQPYSEDVALVTGAAPGSIAAAVVAKLLAGGATVIQTASSVNDARLAFAKELYRRHASVDAKLWLVPANLASLRDVDALVEWISTEQTETVGATTKVVKPALLPTLFFPFAAPPVTGMLGADPHGALAQERLLVWSVERTIHQLSQVGVSTAIDHRVHVVLPGSPNRGTFGGDGAYGESKAAFDAMVNKWRSERGWAERITLAHPLIGWVQGTNLMGGNDRLVPAAQAAGIHVFDTEEMADHLLDLVSAESRQAARENPVEADLTGGLSKVDLPALVARAAAEAAAPQTAPEQPVEHISALPNMPRAQLPAPLDWEPGSARLEDQVVIVGIGEIGTWGSRRTRNDAEVGEELELTAAGVLELAWMMGLLEWKDSPQIGWYDTDGNLVEEAEIFDRYHDEVLARSGVRVLNDDSTIVDQGSIDVATMYLPSDQVFTVDSEDEARDYLQADPSHTQIWFDETWHVKKLAGAAVEVPRRAALTRFVGGQIPQDFDPAKWGIPATMVEALDRIAVWNLVTAVDAFISAGFTPAELLQAVHPAEVSSTQGTGIGGMESLRQVFLSRFLGEDRPQDILQEALPNVVAAHTMQSYVGGYGQMIHPVGACATAAVSVEEGVDKIRLGKSTIVVAGGIDDIGVESLTGFGDMNATANTQAMFDKGICARHISRAGDRRRGGFLEAEGGGTVILARGDVAADLGLPVYAVVAFAQSFADGAHTSIPAPGIGALAAGRGGVESGLARGLRAVGASIDDVAVLSKHDTSTNANDPNEAELHSRLSQALERTSGNPLYVISQKTLTGHAKGGAALFQISGLCEVFADQVVPGNRSLDCLDPVMKPFLPLVWLRRPLPMVRPVRAGVLTSLGFGHVAALIALVHPAAFEATLAAERGQEAAQRWREDANARLARGSARLWDAMTGGEPLFEPIEARRLPTGSEAAKEAEVSMLLDLHARLGADGTYAAAPAQPGNSANLAAPSASADPADRD